MSWLKSRRRRKSAPIAGRGTRWRSKALSSSSRGTPRPYPAPCAHRRPAGQTAPADIPPSTSGASSWAKCPCARTTASPAPASAHRCQTGRADMCRTHFCRRSPPAFRPPDGKTVPPFTVVRPLWISYPVIRAPANGTPSATAHCFSPCRSSSVRCCARSGRLHNPHQQNIPRSLRCTGCVRHLS